ncbi:MAG: tRNA 2-thiouridine(34) synthase MnmA [Candidatus Omnitrophica bacterium]|nr:tRNA 2-thiouridine(34) synthase MnmA [Candidatus Omnitrophota bacterium]
MLKSSSKVFVAMSGGVDSSVTAALLLEQGYDVEGITMCFELPPIPATDRPRCCGLESIEDARAVCKTLGIQHHVLNYGDALEDLVIKNFVSEYTKGRTPNPCVRCNTHLKFDRLFHDAQALGATHLATGHYARIEETQEGWRLKKGADPRKDQSYFLYGIPKNLLPFVLFPLGGFVKDEVRDMARRKNLTVAEKRESQDICFVPDGKYQESLIAWGAPQGVSGVFRDHTDKIVGTHQGIGRYTIGQREGLGIALGYPAYVYRIDPLSHTVFLGPKERLLSAGLEASGLNLVGMNFSKETIEAGIKIRYNHHDIQGSVDILDSGRIRVRFKEPQPAVTPGQSVVFYDGDVLLGGAIIEGAIVGLETWGG